ncbi:MAG: hypothetical protein IPG76_00080 [Acidobacteria bacterium]|nr:hypothetical protein [Acidobacteriota bacterium]
MDTDRSLLMLTSASEVASAFGISGRLSKLFGGHWWHAILACLIYAALYAVALLVEVAYQYDRYGSSAVWVAGGAFTWIFATSLAGLACDWKITSRGGTNGLKASIGIFLLSAMLLFVALCFYLPSNPVTESTLQAYPAQAAYLKTIIYFVILLLFFFLPPYHFVLATQRECLAGRHDWVSGLFSGEKMSVTSRGSIYPKFGVLVAILVVMMAITLFLHQNLMNHLKPGPYMGLFSNLIFTRLALFYALAGECLLWYYMALNELKRECIAVLRISVSRKQS